MPFFREKYLPFTVVYELAKAGRSLPGTEGASRVLGAAPVEYKQMDAYGRAFEERVARTGGEVSA